jgi:hypothetical protein
MLHFRVDGPFEIEPYHGANGRIIEQTAIERFWDRYGEHADATGCYVFGFRASHGMVPVYVGQAKNGFKHECFQHHKLTHYNTALVNRKSGTPIIFFVSRDAGPTSSFEACIDQVERLLIQFALSRNPALANVHRTDWSIQGVYRSKGGEPSNAAKQFRRLLGLDPEHLPGNSGDEDIETMASTDGPENSSAPGA